ncbi:glycosyltransferase family 2 protein [Formosa sp. PL04]|uniref:glycosyltransferase family 2 protein n=1 Tax=Formosa sp. PL04 TaxID=3081755 RepID=UPI002981CA49|nr:glycosyltransferase family 2 protein [Formosa sp. PL04]MDW5290747.1 glycosyltransferase family 2 protein [Formosa sp. PL04]
MNSLVSIILPNYNHAAFLQDRLDSIFNQSYQNFEVIILDDASTDHSLELLNPYKNNPKVSHFIINENNSGSPFKQWEKGLELIKGDFIWIAESDDFCDLNFLESQLECLDASDVAVAKTIAFVKDKSKSEVSHPIFSEEKQKDSILYCPILNVSCLLFKTSLLDGTKDNFYSSFKIIGDRVFYFECFRNAAFIFNAKTLNYFRQSDSSISKLDYRDLRYYSKYFKEHCQFISYAKATDKAMTNKAYKRYVSRFYNRVSNRVSFKQKRSLEYLNLYFLYKLKLSLNLNKKY